MEEPIVTIEEKNGRKMVRINKIQFKGKRSIDWGEVKEYLRKYVGEMYEIAEGNDVIYIGPDHPDEYTGSRYTHKLKGAVAKAKANASQGIPEMLEIASNKRYRDNQDKRHTRNARFGWYLYDILDIKKETSNSLDL